MKGESHMITHTINTVALGITSAEVMNVSADMFGSPKSQQF